MNALKGWISLSTAALAAVIIGFASTILVVMQSADAIHASDAQKISWAAMLCYGMAACTFALSLRHRIPMMMAWSTPGAAMMVSSVKGISYQQGLGAFAICGGLMILTGALKPLAKAIASIPGSIASAMLAGVLLHYVIQIPAAAMASPFLVLPLILVFFSFRLWQPLYAVPVIVVLGLVLALTQGEVNFANVTPEISKLTFDIPEFSLGAFVSLAVPLYFITMASQNLPGFAVLRANGYEPPVASGLIGTGLISVLTAPFSGPQINMAAITASLGAGPDAHPDPQQRWKVSIPFLILYTIVGLAAGVFVKVLTGLPHDLVISLAGLGLMGALQSGLTGMVREQKDLDAALITFIVTASGISLLGVGAAFWGLVAGLSLWGIKKIAEHG